MESKICTKCGETKPLDEFKKDKRQSGGRGSHCKSCHNRYNAPYDSSQEAREEHRKRYGDRYKGRYTDRYREKRRKDDQRRRGNNPLAIQAQRRIDTLKRNGTLPAASSLACVECGNQAAHYHHHLGYEPEHWTDVIPVCHTCHRLLHVR